MYFDFATILFLLTVISGVIWAIDAQFFAAKREAQATDETPAKEPILVDYARSLFPIFLLVLVLRSFLAEPFRIPSGSMVPTLLVGDFILVNKFTYGIRLPVINKKIYAINEPERGDVTVFRFPGDNKTPYIKRIIGLPGDIVEYQPSALRINGELVPQEKTGVFVGTTPAAARHSNATLIRENLHEVSHDIILSHGLRAGSGRFEVPAGHFFVLGDNRDHSRDSRFWGFVPEENLIGKAFYIWMSWDRGINFSRIGSSIE